MGETGDEKEREGEHGECEGVMADSAKSGEKKGRKERWRVREDDSEKGRGIEIKRGREIKGIRPPYNIQDDSFILFAHTSLRVSYSKKEYFRKKNRW